MATAVQVESIWNGLTDNSGQPLAAGKVYTYSAGTTTPVSLYTSSDKSTSATNPLILDGNGKAQVWADGRYKFVVKSAADVTLYTLDNLLYGFDDTTVLLGGISTGSANAQVVSVPATVESYANGQRITFIAGYTNSGAVTLQFNSLAPISIVKGPTSSSLQAGDLIAGQLYSCTYYGGSFRLENVPTPADVQRSRAQVIASVAGINTITGTLTPALTGYETGEVFRFKAANANSSAVTINIDGLGAKAIQYNNAALVAGEIAANVWHEIVYDGTQFQLLNPINVSAPLWGGTTAGTSTAYTITPAPAITAYATGQRFTFNAHTANGASPTLAVSGLAAKNIFDATSLSAIGASRILSGKVYDTIYDGTQFRLLDDAGEVQNGNYIWLGTTGGTATAQTAAAIPAITNYVAGQKFRMLVGAGLGSTGASTTAHTLSINGLTAKNIVSSDGLNSSPTIGTWVAGAFLELVYDGTYFRIVNDPSGWLDYTVTTSNLTGEAPNVVSSITTSNTRFRKVNKTVYVQMNVQINLGTGGNPRLNFTPPVNASSSISSTNMFFTPGLCLDGTATTLSFGYFSSATNFVISKNALVNTNWAAGVNTYIRLVFNYESV